MFGALFLIAFLFFVTQPLLGRIQRDHPYLKVGFMNKLFWYHMVFGGVYYIYTLFNRSDSKLYYYRAKNGWSNWFDAHNTGTDFMEWLAYPFVNYFFFNFEMTMFLFTWFGFIGFIYFYLFFKENLRFTLKVRGYDLITIIMFLPNMHFWTASLGKGAVIFGGLGLLIYGLSKLGKRIPHLLIGAYVSYMVRPHILVAVLIGMAVGFVLGKEKVPIYQKVLVSIVGLVFSIIMYDKILLYLGYDPNNFLESFEEESALNAHRLSYSAGSAVDMSGYSLPMKLFTFWFRPLFIDSPNFLGIIVSLENVLYLYLFSRIISKDFIKYIKDAPAMVKMSGVVFISISISMTFIMSNLGIIIRQKSQIMYFMLFVIIAFLDWQKTIRIKKRAAIYNRIVEEERRRREG
ncbi:hypothetical protein ACFSKL_16285 [Belliella marina]|uniref:Oligosaccharide repeat unit polymerase n=1 Tax=Belliella marina TaxID=1644146 RepID=A0ABW4VNU6_9BACT